MKVPNARWIHAAKVALAATAIVGAITVLLAVVVNTSILHRLDGDIDNRLAATLTAETEAPPGSVVLGGSRVGGDVDDAPVFLWRVQADRSITALSVGAPALPSVPWSTEATTVSTEGRDFRFAAVPSAGGWLVAGESVAKVAESGANILLVELVLGALLLAVTFTGSFIVGLRASAPIEQIRRRQAEFTADASHELRTPLSVIQAEVELTLGRPREPSEYEAALQRIGSESGRLRTIVDDLLWLARADGQAPGTQSDDLVDLSGVASAAAARFSAVADAGSVTLTTRLSRPGTALIRADAEGIDRLIGVVLDNACKYAGPGGAVDVSVSTSGGRVALTVDDSGPGIPQEHRALVLDRFHRADQSPGGTGLGLAIADAVVRASNGTWSIGVAPQGGARVEVIWRHAPHVDTQPVDTATDSPITDRD
ncbi:MAG: HAMP domain-containing sensor histidine kinase [Acidimicrobiales bacterium]